MKLITLLLASLFLIAGAHGDVFDQLKTIGSNVVSAAQDGSSDGLGGAQSSFYGLINDVKYALTSADLGGALGPIFSDHNLDGDSLSSLAQSFENLSSDDQVNVIGELAEIPLDAADSVISYGAFSSRKLLSTKA